MELFLRAAHADNVGAGLHCMLGYIKYELPGCSATKTYLFKLGQEIASQQTRVGDSESNLLGCAPTRPCRCTLQLCD